MSLGKRLPLGVKAEWMFSRELWQPFCDNCAEVLSEVMSIRSKELLTTREDRDLMTPFGSCMVTREFAFMLKPFCVGFCHSTERANPSKLIKSL
jgi:hypothetical protein